jgi:hypothetical protein
MSRVRARFAPAARDRFRGARPLTTLAVAAIASAPLGASAAGPVGQLAAVDCAGIEGWARDPDVPRNAIDVHLYFGGPAGDPAAPAIAITADVTLTDGCVADRCAHGFSSALPMGVLDDLPRPVHAYGIDQTGDPNLQLELSPTELRCPPPPIVGGDKRHVTSPDVLAAWQFSTFFDLLRVSDDALVALTDGAAIVAGPQLVVSDAGDPTVWLLEDALRRPVDPEVAAAWRFDLAAAMPMPAAMLDAVPEGTPWRPRPILLQGSGPEVYLLDDHPCSPGDPDPACQRDPTDDGGLDDDDGASGDDSGGADTGGDDLDPSGDSADDHATTADGGTSDAMPPARVDDDGSGCGCRSHPSGGPALWIAVLAIRRRRRSR